MQRDARRDCIRGAKEVLVELPHLSAREALVAWQQQESWRRAIWRVLNPAEQAALVIAVERAWKKQKATKEQ